MKKRQKRSKGILGLVVLTVLLLTVFIVQVPAYAAVDCTNIPPINNTADYDLDGFTDYDECNGFNLSADSTTDGRINGYNQKGILARNQYLDPNSKDLFVILIKATDVGNAYSNFTTYAPQTSDYAVPPDTYSFTSSDWYFNKTLQNNGLEVAPHLIKKGKIQTDRRVTLSTSTQKAIQATESLNTGTCSPTSCTGSVVLGTTTGGQTTPNATTAVTIYTQRIVNFVTYVYNVVAKCTTCSSTMDPVKADISKYILHTIAHEAGHSMMLAAGKLSTDFGGYHYAPSTANIMEQTFGYTTSSNTVTWTDGSIGGISGDYNGPDKAGFRLK